MSMSCVREALLTSVRCRASARQVPEQPAVHRAHAELAGRRPRLAVRRRVQQPAQLAGREHGVDGQAGAGRDLRAAALGAQALAEVRRAAALPGDRRADGGAAGALPGHPGLALVGDADGGQGRGAGRREALVDALADGLPDGAGVLLHPAGLRVLDGHGPRGLAHDGAPLVDEDGLGVGGALVDGQDQRVAPHVPRIRRRGVRRRVPGRASVAAPRLIRAQLLRAAPRLPVPHARSCRRAPA